MLDQLIIGNRGSYEDFGASVCTRKIKDPVKKKITKTVPFSNVTYDFTKINGEIYWEQRELEYVFEMTACRPEELEEMKIAFSDFVMNVMNEEIFDPFIADYHFVGTFENIGYDDDESIEKTTVTVKFLAYPYKVANSPKKYSRTIEPDNTVTINVLNNSSHKITPKISVAGQAAITFGNISIAIKNMDVSEGLFVLDVGTNVFEVENIGSSACTIEITFREEVF